MKKHEKRKICMKNESNSINEAINVQIILTADKDSAPSSKRTQTPLHLIAGAGDILQHPLFGNNFR